MMAKVLGLSQEQISKVMKLYSGGKYEEAITEIKLLNDLYPNVPLLFNLVGACYRQIGNLEGAAKMFNSAVKIKPNYAEALFNLGATYSELGKVDEAIDSYEKAISFQPNYPDAYNNLGNIFKNSKDDLKLAIEKLEWAIAYKHDFAEAHNNLGLALSDFGRHKDAIQSFKKAISYKNNYGKAYFNLAMSLKDIGDKDGFLANILKALEIRPDWGAAHLHLSRVKNYKKNDPVITEMESFLKKDSLSLVDRIGLNFALAHIYENLKNYQKQFEFLNEANSLRKKEVNYSFEKDKMLFAKIKSVFEHTPEILKVRKDEAHIRPIFILGMPRSGTSLVHQILDSHNKVCGAGELNFLNKFAMPVLKNFNNKEKKSISKKSLEQIRKQYIDSILALEIEEKIIVDKMPLNFRHIGFILAAFPEAKILHMKRNPMATCWSIYKYYFNGNYYSFNQSDLANYFKLYEDLMAFWHKKFPQQIFDVNYENLTSSQELETRQILKFCNLDWDENCLNFHKSQAAVKTTSALQVREKIYQGSSEAWKEYEPFLQPLISELN